MRIEHKYDDIIKLEHHVSKIHPRMSLEARSAQFAPFSAVTGYEDEVSEVARVTENQIEVTDEILNDINKKLSYIKQNPSQQVSITFFVKDTKKQGGKYETTTGLVKKIDDIKNIIILNDGKVIRMEDIIEIIEQKEFYTLNNSKYLLIEFPPIRFPKNIVDIIYEIKI